MSLAISILPGTSSGGGGGSVTPPSAGNLTVTTLETVGSFSIPAGCYWIKIRNAGFVQDGDLETQATVAGVSWSVGHYEELTSIWDQINNIYKLLPAITGNGNGSRVFIAYAM